MRSFHTTAEYHEMFMGDSWGRLRPLLSAHLGQPGHILDAGAGSGLGLLCLATLCPQARFTVIEPDPTMRAMLMARLSGDDALRQRTSVVPLAISPETVDRILDLTGPADVMLASHLYGLLGEGERGALFDVAHRCLTPSGRLLLTVHQPHAHGGDPTQPRVRRVALGHHTLEQTWQPGLVGYRHTDAHGTLVREVQAGGGRRRTPPTTDQIIASAHLHGLTETALDDCLLVLRPSPRDEAAPPALPDIEQIMAAHNRRLAALDPDLGPQSTPSGDPVAVMDEGSLLGTWTRVEHDESSQLSLWGPLVQDVIALRSPEPTQAGELSAIIDRVRVARAARPASRENSLLLRLPTADHVAASTLLGKGLRPATTTSLLRLRADTTVPGAGMVRAPRAQDRDAALGLMEAMHDVDVAWGGSHRRPTSSDLLGQYWDEAAGREGWTWVAEADGEVVGLASMLPIEESAWAAASTSLSPVAYFGFLAVAPEHRGHGVGRALAEQGHARAAEAGAQGVLLDHAALSPLSATFWHRQGYRPLWTTWVEG